MKIKKKLINKFIKKLSCYFTEIVFILKESHFLSRLDPEKEFPSLAELQSSLLCESGCEDAIVSACQSLLFYALYDPGVSGPLVSL